MLLLIALPFLYRVCPDSVRGSAMKLHLILPSIEKYVLKALKMFVLKSVASLLDRENQNS